MSASCPPLIAGLILSALNTGETIGALAIGIPLAAIAYGITVCQAFYYYRLNRAKQDPWYLKTFVAVLMAFVTFQQALLFNMLYYYLASHFDDPCAFLKLTWPTTAATLISGVIGLCVNGFLTNRVWQLSRNFYVAGFCVRPSAKLQKGQGLRSFIGTVLSRWPTLAQTFQNTDALEEVVALQTKGIAGWAVAILADSSIVVSIIFYLYRSRTGIRRSNDMISRLMILTVSTGMLTTCVAITGLVLYAIFPSSFYPAIVEFVVGKLYLNSLLTTLNMRDSILNDSAESTSHFINSIPLSHSNDRVIKRAEPKVMNVIIDGAMVERSTSLNASDTDSSSAVERKPGEMNQLPEGIC